MNRKDRRAKAKSGAASTPGNPADLLRQAVGHHQAGRAREAMPLYDQVLASHPDHADALHYSGVLLAQTGNPADGAQRLTKAVRLMPQRADFHANLGQVLVMLGRMDDAEQALRTAVGIEARLPDAHNNLGNVLKAKNQLDDAEAAYRKAVEINPQFAGAWNNLGNLLSERGDDDGAESALREAIRLSPNYAAAHNNLGALLLGRGDTGAAEVCFQQALRHDDKLTAPHEHLGSLHLETRNYRSAYEHLAKAVDARPDEVGLRLNLANALWRLNQPDKAEAIARDVLAQGEDNAPAWQALGTFLHAQQKLSDAEQAFQRVLALDPGNGSALNGLGLVFDAQGRLSEAVAAYEDSAAARPGHAATLSNLGVALVNAGRIDEGIAAYRRSLDNAPGNAWVGSNLLMALNYQNTPHAQVMAEHRDWADRHTPADEPAAFDFGDRDRDHDRPLRIGVVSPDLRRHSIAYFFESLLESLDQTRYPVTCYAEVRRPDDVTERLRNLAQGWVDTPQLDDEALAKRIHDDEIDIVLDLAGHTRGNRLPALVYRPAPVQTLWLGAPDTSGLAAIDYRFTDAIADPPGLTEQWHTERLLHLPTGLNCYRPDAHTPDVEPQPLDTDRPIVFTSFNNWSKVGPETIAMWAGVLARVPDSRLFLKTRTLADPAIAQGCRAAFAGNGIDPGRIEIAEWAVEVDDHLAHYNRCDIALDTWPYSGHTTSCEALWMGVPVVTRTGDRMGARVTASILNQVGLDELVAEDSEAFVEIAAALATDRERLSRLRGGLRDRMAESPLCDGDGFARAFESAFRDAWKTWCTG